AEGIHRGSQDQDRDTQLQQVADEERHGAKSHGARGAAGQNQQLRQATQMDERQPRQQRQRQAPPPFAVSRNLPDGERRDGISEQVAAGRSKEPGEPGEAVRREHRQAERAETQVQDQARRAQYRPEQAADEQYGEGLERERHGRSGQGNRYLRSDRHEGGAQDDRRGAAQRERLSGEDG